MFSLQNGYTGLKKQKKPTLEENLLVVATQITPSAMSKVPIVRKPMDHKSSVVFKFY